MGVSGEKVRLVGQFEILAQDNFFEQNPSSRTIYFEIMSYWTDSGVQETYNCNSLIGNFQCKLMFSLRKISD